MRRWLLISLRLLLAAVFIYAAYTKLRQPWLVFAMSVDSYRVLPEWAVLAVARILPWGELLIGILLLSGFFLRYASFFATALLLLFFVLMLRSYGKGMGIDCGCFGLGEPLSVKTLVRDGTLLACSIGLLAMTLLKRGTS